MATFGPIASAMPNVLYNPIAVDQAVMGRQRNQLMMDNARQDQQAQQEDRRAAVFTRDREHVARASASILALPADQRPTAYASTLRELQAAGIAPHAPQQYPGDAQLQALVQGGLPVAAQLQRQDQQAERASLAGMFGGAPASAPTTAGGGYLATLRGQENNTGNPAARNPRSSATGDFQFIDGTWREYAQANPDRFAGMNDQQILARRSDPSESERAAEWYRRENSRTLAANGLPGGDGEAALAHRFGPQGAIAALRADPSAPAGQVFGQRVMAANPDLAGMTVGQVVQQYQRRYGGGGQPGPMAGGAAVRTGGADVAGPGAPTTGLSGPAGAGGLALDPPGTPPWAAGTTAEDQQTLREMAQSRGVTREEILREAARMRQANRTFALQQRDSDRRNAPSAGGGPIGGNGLDSALLNILIQGDPSSPQYAAAFARLGAEEVLANGNTRRPDMSPFRAPTYRPPGVVEPSGANMGAAPPSAGQGGAMVAGPASSGPAMQEGPGGAPALPQGGRSYGTAQTTQVQQVTPQAREAVRKAEAEVGRITSAIDRFEQVFRQQGGSGFNAFINNPTDPKAQSLLGAYEAMKATLRSEAFLNTGVLQPAEAKMLDDMLLSPQSLRGATATPEAMRARLDEFRGMIRRGLEQQRQSAGISRPVSGPNGQGTAEPPGNIPPPPPGFRIH